ncbi:MAG: GTP-binding protein [Cephaloticoccus sp.]|nr:GTP-binding protein [Cephaloticoccus sp.]MCF7761331.1 GTP-binding protein [Cephaloticoccus sp.]
MSTTHPYLAMDLLRFTTAGSVDDGKSTLIGRLLYDSKAIFEDTLENLQNVTRQRGEETLNLSLLTDGLRAEREQGITIDVAYRYFATPKRKFIIADTPGHIQYTRNMVTGASTANLAVILIDARKGVIEQTCRHSFIASLLGLPHVIVAVNKMDLVDWSEDRFNEIVAQFAEFASRLDIPDIKFIPLSALHGDNVVDKSIRMPWYQGGTLLYTLETTYIGSDHNHVDARFPIQTVIRPNTDLHHDFRGFAGRVAGGVFKPGDEIVSLPSGQVAQIKSIRGPSGEISEAFAPMSVVMTLDREIDSSRGNLFAKRHNQPNVAQDLEAMICWFDSSDLKPRGRYLIRHTSRETQCSIKDVRYKVDINTLHKQVDNPSIGMNDIARVHLRTAEPLMIDRYKQNRTTGSFILVDPFTHATVAAGMIVTPNMSAEANGDEEPAT